MKMLAMLVWTALLLAGSGAHPAPRAFAKAFQQTQAAQQKQNNVPSTGAFQITGRVVNSMTNAPVAGAYVVINAASGSSVSRTVRAGTDGSFAFTEIPAGRYVLMARRKGYVEQMYLQHERFTTAILAGPNLNTENLVFPLPPEGVISGQVTDEVGEPVQFARMLLFREDSQNGRRMKRLQAREHTDDEGEYRFASLSSGDYYVVVLAEPWYAMYARANHSSMRSTHAQKPALDSSNLDVVFPITYYPNGTDANGAAPIRVETGSGARADMRLVPVPALHMRLEVGETGSETVTQVLVTHKILGTYQDQSQVSAEPVVPDGASGNGEDEDAAQSSGPVVLELTGLRPGPSVIQVTADNAKDSAHSGKVSKSVPVDPANGQTLDLRGIARAAVVSGNVRVEGNASAPSGVLVFLRSSSNGNAFRQDVDSAGNFSFSSDEIEPGVYELFAATPGGLELRSVTANGTKMTGRKIEISNGSDLRLTLTLGRGVSGRVKGIVERGGKPAPGMMVVLVPEDLRELGEYRRDQSDSDGSFSLNGVSPGKYTVVALNDWNLEWGKPELIREYVAGGTSVEVAGGEERDIKVTTK
jgi:hypothetical protein